MSKKHPAVTITMIDRYLTHLREQERSAATLQKYRHDLNELCGYLHNAPLNKSALIDWKELLISKYAPATVNSMLIAVNGYLRFYGWQGLSVKLLKVQKALFIDESKELTKAEYDRLVQEAQRQGRDQQQRQTAYGVPAGQTASASSELCAKTKKDRRGGIHHPDG